MRSNLLYTLFAAADYQRAVLNSGLIVSVNGRKPRITDIKYVVHKNCTVSFVDVGFNVGWYAYIDKINQDILRKK